MISLTQQLPPSRKANLGTKSIYPFLVTFLGHYDANLASKLNLRSLCLECKSQKSVVLRHQLKGP